MKALQILNGRIEYVLIENAAFMSVEPMVILKAPPKNKGNNVSLSTIECTIV
jgi:hypothetical protein